MTGLEGSFLRACRWDVLRTMPVPNGVGEAVAVILLFGAS